MKINGVVVFLCLLFFSLVAHAEQTKPVQKDSSQVKTKNTPASSFSEKVIVFDSLTIRQQKSYHRQMHRDSVRAHK